MTLVTVTNLSHKPLKNVSFVLRDKKPTILFGANSSGKTTLLKCLSGIIKTENSVRVNRTFLEKMNPYEKEMKMQTIFDLPFSFSCDTVEEELMTSLEQIEISKEEKRRKIKDYASRLNISKELKQDPSTLSFSTQQKLRIIRSTLKNPSILFMDDIFKYLKEEEKEEVCTFLKFLQDTGMLLFLVTRDPSLVLFFQDAVIHLLHQGRIVKSGTLLEVFEEDSLISRMGLKLPFMVDLSIKLKYYNLLDQVIFDKEGMVNCLWK